MNITSKMRLSTSLDDLINNPKLNIMQKNIDKYIINKGINNYQGQFKLTTQSIDTLLELAIWINMIAYFMT